MKTEPLVKIKRFMRAVCCCTFVLYLALFAVLAFTVDAGRMAAKTVNYLKWVPRKLLFYAEGKETFTPWEFYDAIRYYKNFLTIHDKTKKNDSVVNSIIGFCYYHIGKYEKAIHYYQKADDLVPGLLGMNYNLGLIYFEKGDYAQALKFFKRAAIIPINKKLSFPRVDPFNTRNPDLLMKRRDQIKDVYAKCYEMVILSSVKVKDFDTMLQFSLYGLNLGSSDDERFYYYAGLANYYLQDYEKAVFYLRNCVRINSRYVQGYHYLGLAFKALNQANNYVQAMQLKERFSKKGIIPSYKDNVSSAQLYYYPMIYYVTIKGKTQAILM